MRTAIILVMAGLLGLTGVRGADTPGNLQFNGSFEEPVGDDGLVKGWGLGGEPADAYKLAVVSGGHSGEKALQVEGDGKYGVVGGTHVEIDRSKRYTARGWFKVEGPDAKATIKFDYFDDQGAYVGSTDYGQINATDWQQVCIQDRAENFPKAKTLAVVLVLLGKGKARFDDMELTASAATKSTNLLANGGMENVIGDKAAGYWTGGSDGSKAEWTVSTDKPKEGRRCLHVKGSGEWVVASSEHVKREKDKTYTLTGWVRVKSGEVHIKIDGFKDNEWVDHILGENVSGSDWQQLTVTLTPSDLADATEISATVAGLGDVEADFDDLVLTAK